MTHSFFVHGTLPGLNEYTEANRKNPRIGNSMKRKAQDAILREIREQLPGIRIERPVKLHYVWVESSMRRDHDNTAFAQKFVQDALVESGVLSGDGWKQITGFTHGFAVDKENPGVKVILQETGSSGRLTVRNMNGTPYFPHCIGKECKTNCKGPYCFFVMEAIEKLARYEDEEERKEAE